MNRELGASQDFQAHHPHLTAVSRVGYDRRPSTSCTLCPEGALLALCLRAELGLPPNSYPEILTPILVNSGCHGKILQTRGLNSRHLFLIILEIGKSMVKILDESVLNEGSLPGV